jgi:uncharacterized flavoprotein (TIGR03862 family)
MAADGLSAAGLGVTLYERMPSVGRKLLMAGRGGLNLTHSENFEKFPARYGKASAWLAPILEAFPPQALIGWAEGLGQEIFVGSSGRVFPKAMKASPLLRAWLARLGQRGVRIKTRHEWRGWDDKGDLLFQDGNGAAATARADATILALGGASWPRLGSNGAWVELLRRRGVCVAALRPANCGFAVPWSESFRSRFAGAPLKGIAMSFAGRSMRGEALITDYGIEGGAIYALSADLRDEIEASGRAGLEIDLRPDLSREQLATKLGQPAKGHSLSTHLRKTLRLPPVAINLLREVHGIHLPSDAVSLSALIKSLPLKLTGTQPIERAISSAGGVDLGALDAHLMILPGVFAAGEMLDWEAPTGGYLLQATLATGVAAAKGVLRYLDA